MNGTSAGRASPAVADGSWIRSSRCTPGNNCVELWPGLEVVGVRDSKNSDSEVLIFGREQWISFVKDSVC